MGSIAALVMLGVIGDGVDRSNEIGCRSYEKKNIGDDPRKYWVRFSGRKTC